MHDSARSATKASRDSEQDALPFLMLSVIELTVWVQRCREEAQCYM